MSCDTPYVPQTEFRVPFPLIDFEVENDQPGKAIREIITNWNVSSAELMKFGKGDYKIGVSFLRLEIEGLVAFMRFFGDCCKYVSPEQQEYARVESICKSALSELIRVRKGYYGVSTRTGRSMVHSMIREVMAGKFLYNILKRLRELLASKPVEGTNVEPTSGPGVEADTEGAGASQSPYLPFRDWQDAYDSLIKCLHYIVVDHMSRGVEIDYTCADFSKDPWDAPGDVCRACHWSLMYQYLRKDIEMNGEVPHELQFFYGTVELASRLERISKQQFRELRECQEQEHIKDVFPTLVEARKYYGCNYEAW